MLTDNRCCRLTGVQDLAHWTSEAHLQAQFWKPHKTCRDGLKTAQLSEPGREAGMLFLGSGSYAVFWSALHLGLSHLYFVRLPNCTCRCAPEVRWVKSCTPVSLHMPAASEPHRAMLLTGCLAPTLQLQLQLCLGAALCPLRLAFWATMALLTSLRLAVCPWAPGHPGDWPSPLTPPPCSGCDPAVVHWPSCFWQLSAPCTTTTTTFRPTAAGLSPGTS